MEEINLLRLLLSSRILAIIKLDQKTSEFLHNLVREIFECLITRSDAQVYCADGNLGLKLNLNKR